MGQQTRRIGGRQQRREKQGQLMRCLPFARGKQLLREREGDSTAGGQDTSPTSSAFHKKRERERSADLTQVQCLLSAIGERERAAGGQGTSLCLFFTSRERQRAAWLTGHESNIYFSQEERKRESSQPTGHKSQHLPFAREWGRVCHGFSFNLQTKGDQLNPQEPWN